MKSKFALTLCSISLMTVSNAHATQQDSWPTDEIDTPHHYGSSSLPGVSYSITTNGHRALVAPMEKSFFLDDEAEQTAYAQAYEQARAALACRSSDTDDYDASINNISVQVPELNDFELVSRVESLFSEDNEATPQPQTPIGRALAPMLGQSLVCSVGSWLGYTYKKD